VKSQKNVLGGNTLIRLPEETGNPLALNGSCCRKCGRNFFPEPDQCSVCGSLELDAISMGRKGTLYSYTICRYPPPGGKYKGRMPYALGIITLDEGILIPARIVTDNPHLLKTGQRVELCLDSWEDKEGNETVCHAYRLAAQAS